MMQIDPLILQSALSNAPPKEKARILELVEEVNTRNIRAKAQNEDRKSTRLNSSH